MPTPTWVSDAVFYQIFPDRFARGNGHNPPGLRAWESRPTRRGYHGGDLRGITGRLDYLQDLGVNAIYFNPIFHAPTNHRYNATDYMRIDPLLGDLKDFQELIAAAKHRGMRVILDGVLNHSGREFFAFQDVLEKGENSAYKDWFFIHRYPLNAYGRGKATEYEAWWGFRELPKLNTDNPEVRKYLFDMTLFWLDQGIDGWRLDVPNEIGFPFWEQYSRVVKAANPEAYLVGEIWHLQPEWTQPGRLDGLMNYPLRKLILEGLGARLPNTDVVPSAVRTSSLAPSQMAAQAEALWQAYPAENNLAMYNLLASHDTTRTLTALRGHAAKTRLAYALLFAFPGAPAIYYGDEVGMRGGKDPASRGGFPWDERSWDVDLRDWIKTLIAARKASAPLKRGVYYNLLHDDAAGVFSFGRRLGTEQVAAVFNFSSRPAAATLDAGALGMPGGAQDLLSGQRYVAEAGRLAVRLPAWGVAWLAAV